MRIWVTSTDSEEPEVYDSAEALEEELELSADPAYTAEVMTLIRAGREDFTMANGSDTDHYYVAP